MHLGQIIDKKIQKDPKNPTATSEELGARTGCREQKQGTAHAPWHSTPPKGWAKHLSHPSSLTHPYSHPIQGTSSPLFREQAREPVACSRSPLLQQGPRWSPAWISYLGSSQFLWILEGQGPWSVSLPLQGGHNNRCCDQDTETVATITGSLSSRLAY